jgi:hypothetical protein
VFHYMKRHSTNQRRILTIRRQASSEIPPGQNMGKAEKLNFREGQAIVILDKFNEIEQTIDENRTIVNPVLAPVK